METYGRRVMVFGNFTVISVINVLIFMIDIKAKQVVKWP